MRTKENPAGCNRTGRVEKAGANLQTQNTIPPRWRQRLKSLIFWLGVRGALPSDVVDWMIQRGGMSND